MKFKMEFGKIKVIIMAAVALCCIGAAVFDVVLLAGADGLKTSNPVVVGVSLGAVLIAALAALLLLFNSYYRCADDDIVITLGFFVSRISYDSVQVVRVNSKTRKIALAVSLSGTADELVLGADATIVNLDLRAADCDKFLDELRKNCDATIEIFTPEEKQN